MQFLNFFRGMEKPAEMARPPSPFPQTLEEAVTRLLNNLDAEQQHKLALLSEQSIEGLNYGLGARIRRDFGLWHGNPALMRSCETCNPEDTSIAIIRATWARLRG